VDDELERLRRLRQYAPGDVTSALRLSSNLERVGRAGDAFDLLAVLSASCSQGEKGLELRHAVAALARRNPRLVHEHVLAQPYKAARLSLMVLAEAGAHATPVVLACRPIERETRLRHRRAAAFRALARVHPGVGLEDAIPDSDYYVRAIPAWVILSVRTERDWSLLPWVAYLALLGPGRTHQADEARVAFQLLAGVARPPLDVEDVARRMQEDARSRAVALAR
jgi:hypothetical protein